MFEYPITRQRPVVHLALLVSIGVIGLVVAILLTIVGSCYEDVPQLSPYFNTTIGLWYEVFVPHHLRSFTPEAWSCEASTIKINEGFYFSTKPN
jgi:hypothetical protein